MRSTIPVVISMLVVAIMMRVEASGKLELLLLSWQNTNDKLYDGTDCDNFPFRSDCENYFKFCLNFEPKLPTTMQQCNPKGYQETEPGTWSHGNSLTFKRGQNLGTGLSNPLIFPFDGWNRSFGIFIEALDKDTVTKSDLIDRLRLLISNIQITSKAVSSYSRHTLRGSRPTAKTSFVMNIRGYCDATFFGSTCDVVCVPTSSYSCNQSTGDKVCHAGLYGINCDVYCVARNDSLSHYDCSSNGTTICQSDYYGLNCTRYCSPSNDTGGRFTCSIDGERVCDEGWKGEHCNETLTNSTPTPSLTPTPTSSPGQRTSVLAISTSFESTQTAKQFTPTPSHQSTSRDSTSMHMTTADLHTLPVQTLAPSTAYTREPLPRSSSISLKIHGTPSPGSPASSPESSAGWLTGTTAGPVVMVASVLLLILLIIVVAFVVMRRRGIALPKLIAMRRTGDTTGNTNGGLGDDIVLDVPCKRNDYDDIQGDGRVEEYENIDQWHESKMEDGVSPDPFQDYTRPNKDINTFENPLFSSLGDGECAAEN